MEFLQRQLPIRYERLTERDLPQSLWLQTGEMQVGKDRRILWNRPQKEELVWQDQCNLALEPGVNLTLSEGWGYAGFDPSQGLYCRYSDPTTVVSPYGEPVLRVFTENPIVL